MNDGDYLGQHYIKRNGYTQTYHAALLQDFTGKSLETLVKEETFYIGWGFSYQVFCKNQTDQMWYSLGQRPKKRGAYM